jgi:hypothetical protein
MPSSPPRSLRFNMLGVVKRCVGEVLPRPVPPILLEYSPASYLRDLTFAFDPELCFKGASLAGWTACSPVKAATRVPI